jgi:hypothetical protein
MAQAPSQNAGPHPGANGTKAAHHHPAGDANRLSALCRIKKQDKKGSLGNVPQRLFANVGGFQKP